MCPGLSDRDHLDSVGMSGGRFHARRMHVLWRLCQGVSRWRASRQRVATMALGGQGAGWPRMPGTTRHRMPHLWRPMQYWRDSIQPARRRAAGAGDRQQCLHRLRRLRGAVPGEGDSGYLILPTKRFSTSAGASTCGTWQSTQLWRAASKALVAATKWLSPSLGAFFLT